MPVSYQQSENGKKLQISVKGSFDYRLSQKFRDSYRIHSDQQGITYHIDLSETCEMDSSALGMLLLLREHAKSRGGVVLIEHPNENIHSFLKVASFEQLFAIKRGNSTGSEA